MSNPNTGQRAPIDLILVEDSAVDAELEVDALREAGLVMEVRRVEDEPAFRAALDERLPDAILADWTLPHFSGRVAMAVARERCPGVPFIFVSGTIAETAAIEALRNGAIDYVYKNQLQQLAPALIRALEESETKRQLRASNERRNLIISHMPQGCITWDREFRVESWNPAAERIFGFTSADAMGKHPYGFIVPDEAKVAVDTIWTRLLEGDDAANSVNENTTKDGRKIICEWMNTAIKRTDGTVISVLSIVQDITERRQMEAKILATQVELQRLLDTARQSRREMLSVIEDQKEAEQALLHANRALQALSQVNGVLVKVTDQQTLLDQTCRLLVESGGYRLAWIGWVEHDAAKTVRVAAHHGDDHGYLESMQVAWADLARGQGPSGRAIRSGQLAYTQDILADPHVCTVAR